MCATLEFRLAFAQSNFLSRHRLTDQLFETAAIVIDDLSEKRFCQKSTSRGSRRAEDLPIQRLSRGMQPIALNKHWATQRACAILESIW